MKIAGYGEDRLVAELTRPMPRGKYLLVGPGDDCAVIGLARDASWQLLKCDVVVEGVHFLPTDDPRRVGWKAICRAISDIAAMGGIPEYALITIAVSPGQTVKYVRALFAGLSRAARRFGIGIAGGETSRSPGPLFLDIALTGTVERTHCVLRSGGKPGDLLYVTGRLGGSRLAKHLDFKPRLAEGRWLAEHVRPSAMMDLSDGVAADLPRLAASSRCGFLLDESAIPRTRGATTQQALSDGEDFELLFAIPPRRAASLESSWRKAFPKLPLTRIGELTPRSRSKRTTRPQAANRKPHPPRGFDHFA